MKKIILGVDPGTVVLGYAVLEVYQQKLTLASLGVLQLHKYTDPLLKLKKIYDRVYSLCKEYKVNELAVESPFYGKNAQSMLKLGRAQGSVIIAGLNYGIEVYEYLPKKIKQSVTGRGAATKEQVAAMLQKMVELPSQNIELDATDALATAVCHYYQNKITVQGQKFTSWKDFLNKNNQKVKE